MLTGEALKKHFRIGCLVALAIAANFGNTRAIAFEYSVGGGGWDGGGLSQPNGCGAEGSWLSQFIPNSIWGIYDFEKPCDNHDICVETPYADRGICDDQFLQDLIARCDDQLLKPLCLFFAEVYSAATSSVLGENAYQNAQEAAFHQQHMELVADLVLNMFENGDIDQIEALTILIEHGFATGEAVDVINIKSDSGY